MGPSRALIILPVEKSPQADSNKADTRNPEEQLEEAAGLAHAIDLYVVEKQLIKLPKITPATFIGKGKVEELAYYIKDEDIDLVIVDRQITPIQQRNLEKALCCKVIDRTALILEIFGARANTKEGTLQVALAALEYQKSRLVRSWTHLERQRGGAGFMGGPGERQIESDRRMLRERITKLKGQLDRVVKTRELHRESRKKIPYPIVALVGYTNAGKSTLFNALSDATVLAEDKLFATLDPSMRLIKLPSGKHVILSDTVGFISNLPTELVAAFRATLEEVVEADILLHVRDIAQSTSLEQRNDVIKVLRDLGVEDKFDDQTIEIYNKIDLAPPGEYDDALLPESVVAISAIEQIGFDSLLTLIDKKLSADDVTCTIKVSAANGALIAWIHAHCTVIEEVYNDDQIDYKLLLSPKHFGQLQKKIKI